MSISKGGRTLQDCYGSLGAAVKRKRSGEKLSEAKRQCILEEQLPAVMTTTRRAQGADSAHHGEQLDLSETLQIESLQDFEQDEVTVDFVKYIEEQKKLVQHDMDRLEEKRKAFFSKQSDLIGVYMYGLEKISKLTDVRDAPDAILPGNQI